MRRTKKEKPGLNAQLRKSAQNWREFEDTLRVVEEAAGKNPTLTAKVLLESTGKWLNYWKKKVEKLSQETPSAQTIGQRGTHLDTLCQFAQWNTAWVLMNYACAAAQRSGEDPNELMCEAFQQVFRAAPAMYGELMQDVGLQQDRIRQATTTVLSGWVGTQIHLGEDMKNQRLKKALDEEGTDSPHKRRQLVSEKLPAATHLAWADTKPGDPLRPGSAKRNLVSRAEDYITKEGREAIDKPQWVEDFVEKEDRKNTEGQRVWQTSQDYPDKAEVSLDEWQGWEDLRATLPKHEFEVLALTHQGRSQKEIAQELGIAVDTVKKRKARAKKRLEPKRNAG